MASLLANDLYGLRGKALSIPEATAIQASLVVQAEKHKANVQFWGKISGYSNDYYIAEVLSPEGPLHPRTGLYSIDGGVNWSALPLLNADQVDFCEQLRGRFLGQPDFLYKVRRDVPPEPEVVPELPPAAADGEEGEEDAEGGDEEKEEGEGEAPPEAAPEDEGAEGDDKGPKKQKPKFQIVSMPEICRVSHFVTICNQSCRVVPRGAFVLKPNGALVKNRTFAGLDVDSARKLSSYLHATNVPLSDLSANKELFGPTFSATTDFLPCIQHDRPDGIWSLQFDATLGAVSLENLLFEGSYFFLKTDSTEYCQVYFGTGERNLDLCFVLP